MSKIYTDLNTVLTPYATAIKKNASDITSLNGSLENLDATIPKDSIELLKYVLEHAVYTTDNMQGYVDDLVTTLSGDMLLKGGAYVPKKVIRGAYIDNTGAVVSASNASGYFEEFIKIPSSIGGNLCGCYSSNVGSFRISEYDSNKNFIKQTAYDNSYNFDITLTGTTEYIRFGFYTFNVNAPVPVFSVGVPDVTNATLLSIEIGDISNTTGEDVVNSKRARSAEIELESNIVSVYGCFWAPTIKKWGGSNAVEAIRCYGQDHTYLGASSALNNDVTNLELPTGTKYIRFIFQKNNYSIAITPANYPLYVNGIKYKLLEV